MLIGKFLSGQGLGNQLWNYAAIRSIAEQTGMDYFFYGKNNFKGNNFLEIALSSGSKNQQYVQASPTIKNIFNETIFYDKALDYFASSFDSRVNHLPPNVYCKGLFQSEDYFYGDTSRIRNYIQIRKDCLENCKIPSNVCVLNLRGGEYKRHKKFILPMAYWQNAINIMRSLHGDLDFIVVTDDYKYAKALFPQLQIVHGSISKCYATIYNAHKVIVSNSTFSYFPIKGSIIPKTVIAPKYWARHNDSINRWASPANLYSDWLWLDKNGHLFSYDECLPECRDLNSEYFDKYTVCVPEETLATFTFRKFIPKSIKLIAKKLLSKFFPTKFG